MKQIYGSQSAVEFQTLAQVQLGRHLDTIRPTHSGQAHGAQKNGIEGCDLLEYSRRHRVAAAQILVRAHTELREFKAAFTQARFDGPQNLYTRLHHFGSDTVSRQYCYASYGCFIHRLTSALRGRSIRRARVRRM